MLTSQELTKLTGVRFCIGSPNCEVCGALHPEGVHQKCPSKGLIVPNPVVTQFTEEEHKKLLGDWMQDYFKAKGWTDLYEQARKEWGLPPGCESCEKRKEWINNIHRWVEGIKRKWLS